jgi:hypothetical protein
MSTIFYTESNPKCATSTVAASATTATITAPTGMTAYINGFVVNGLGATAASVIAITVTGVLGGTQTYQYSVPAGVTTISPSFQVNFPMPVPASGVSTNIVVNVPSFGAGNTNANVTVYGYVK